MTYLTPQSTWFGQQPTWFAQAATANASSRALSALQREMDRFLDQFDGSPSAPTGHSVPRLSVSESDNSVEIEVELPGVDDKDIEVMLNEDGLTIKGEKRIERDEQQ